MSFLILLPLLFSVFLWLRLFNRFAFRGGVSVDFPLFYAMGFVLYIIMPVTSLLLKNDSFEEDFGFFIDSLILSISVLIGAFCGVYILQGNRVALNVKPDINRFEQKPLKLSNTAAVVLVVSILMVLKFYLNEVYGSLFDFFTQRYGVFEVKGINSLTSFIPFFLCGLVLTYNSRFVLFPRFGSFLVITVSILIVVVFLLGGNRNIAVMFIFAIGWSFLFSRNVNFYKVLVFLVFGAVLAAVLAVFREYGVINIILGTKSVDINDLTRYILAVNEGEFGTIYRVSKYAEEFSFEVNNLPGFSYFISPIINLIPTFIYPVRPNTIAVDFTMQYWAAKPMVNSDSFIIGLGFSPIQEAKVNFGGVWFLMFVLFGLIGAMLCQFMRMRKLTFQYYALFGSLSVVSLNFFRIDFALFFKFFVLIYFVSKLFFYVSKFISKK